MAKDFVNPTGGGGSIGNIEKAFKVASKKRGTSDGYMAASKRGQQRQFAKHINMLRKHPSDVRVEEEIKRGAIEPQE